jgi:hypothetical protein
MARATKFKDVQVTGTATLAATTCTDTLTMAAAKAIAMSAAGWTMGAIARTATADGTGTGTIADGPQLQFVAVTSDNADKIVVLPAPVPGTIVVLKVNAAFGCELRTSAPATVKINGGAEANAESALAAGTLAVLVCGSATEWFGWQLAAADGTLAKVQVAAAA